MGNASRRKSKFVADHPWCCFCGGTKATQSQDHIPGRQFFSDRKWPVQYVFPACNACNRRTKKAEDFCASFSKMLRPWGSPFKDDEATKAIRAFAQQFGPELNEMFLKPNEVRRYLREHDLDRPDGFLEDSGIMRVPGAANQYVAEFGAKLACALHYKETGRIVRASQPISLVWLTNEAIVNGTAPIPAGAMINRMPDIGRGQKDFAEEFDYRWNANADKDIFGFTAAFGSAFCIVGGIFAGAREVDFPLYDIFGNPLNTSAQFN